MKKLFKSFVAIMIISMMALSLTSCGAKPTKVIEDLKAMGYYVVSIENQQTGMLRDENIETKVDAVTIDNIQVTIFWYKTLEAAKGRESFILSLGIGISRKCVRKGKILVYGDAKAVDDALSVL